MGGSNTVGIIITEGYVWNKTEVTLVEGSNTVGIIITEGYVWNKTEVTLTVLLPSTSVTSVLFQT